jgi:glycosyltransferase involved in cell wall biosynthesis
MTKIVAVVMARNEVKHIADCFDTLQWADVMMLSDPFSDDGTTEAAQAKGAVVYHHQFANFAANRNLALSDAAEIGADWALFVDADERVTPELAVEIREAVAREEVGWWVPRYNVMWGHIMRGGGWYPDCQLRLLKVGEAHYDPSREVHETVNLAGSAGTLREHLIHYNYESPAHFAYKQARYLDFEAKVLHKQGIRAKPWTYLSMPLREFHRRYVKLAGYKDGWVGLQVCGMMAWYRFKTYLRLRQLYREAV